MSRKSLFIVFGCTAFMLGVFFVFVFIGDKKISESLALENDNLDEYKVKEVQVDNIQEQEYGISEKEYFRQIRKEKEVISKEKEIKIKEEIVEDVKNYKSFDFIVIADSESYKAANGHEKKFESVLVRAASYKSDFAMFTGDIITQGDPDKYRVKNVKKLIEKYFEDYYISFGKHDIECGAPCVDVWQNVLFDKKYKSGEVRKLYHSFDYENTHFVLLSSDYPIKHAVDDEQLAWLNTDLKKNDKPNVIVVVHVPPVTFFKESAKEDHDMTYNVAQRDKLLNLLRKYKVDLVLSGHEHAFDHKIVDGIDYVLAGAVGKSKRYKNSIYKDSFLYVTVSGNKIILKSFGLDGELIREIRVK